MYLGQFEYLCEIERTHSINAAAQQLYVSQQTLSRAIQRLEAELGVTILERSARGVVFTPEGKVVLEAAHGVHNSLKSMREQLQGIPCEECIELCYGVTIAAYRSYMSSTLRWFRKQHPDTVLERKIAPVEELADAVASGEIEFAVVSFLELNGRRLFQPPEGIIFHEACRQRLLVMISERHPCARYHRPSLKTMCRYPHIIQMEQDEETSPMRQALSLFGGAKVVEANNDAAISDLTRDGVGWAFTMEGLRANSSKGMVTRVPKENLSVVVGCFVKEGSHPTDLARTFVRAFTENNSRR